MAGRTAGPIKTKLGIGTHVDLRSVLVKVKVKVFTEARRTETIDRRRTGPQGRENRGPQGETTPSGGRVLTASTNR